MLKLLRHKRNDQEPLIWIGIECFSWFVWTKSFSPHTSDELWPQSYKDKLLTPLWILSWQPYWPFIIQVMKFEEKTRKHFGECSPTWKACWSSFFEIQSRCSLSSIHYCLIDTISTMISICIFIDIYYTDTNMYSINILPHTQKKITNLFAINAI